MVKVFALVQKISSASVDLKRFKQNDFQLRRFSTARSKRASHTSILEAAAVYLFTELIYRASVGAWFLVTRGARVFYLKLWIPQNQPAVNTVAFGIYLCLISGANEGKHRERAVVVCLSLFLNHAQTVFCCCCLN